MSQSITRLELPDMHPDLASYLQPRVQRLGYLGELFKCAGHTPAVLLHFMHFTDALKAALPDRLTEVGALTVAALMDNQYERNQHERLSVRLGFGRDWVAEVNALNPDAATLMSEAERALQAYTIAAVDTRGHGVEAQFARLCTLLTPAQAMSVVMLVGRYMTHALTVNTLRLKPPVPSIFEDGFNG
jgi:alkylhydroperoxidase family enzyme